MASSAPVADAPRVTGDPSFGGLVQIGETLVGAVKRLEARKDYATVIASDNGQRLLEAVNQATRDARNGKGRRAPKALTAEEAPEQAAAAVSDVDPGPFLGDVPLDLIDIGENVRVDPGELAELAASIRELGVLQPIRVIGPSHDGRYRAVWGQRRVMASIIAEKATIPALIELDAEANVPGARRSIEQLAENLQRKDLNPIEEAVAMRAVLDADPTLTQEQLAARLGRSGAWLSNALRLLTLSETALEAVRSGKLSASHGRALASLTPKHQADLVEQASGGRMSSHQLEQSISWRAQEAAQAAKKAKRTAALIPKAIQFLTDAPDVDWTLRPALAVSGPYDEIDVEAVSKAVKKAGFRVEGSGSYGYKPEDMVGICDCTALTLNIGARDKLSMARRCVVQAHVDAKYKADGHFRRVERERDDRARAHREDALPAVLAEAPLGPLALRLAIHALVSDVGYGRGAHDFATGMLRFQDPEGNAGQALDDFLWTALEAHADAELPDALAAAIHLALFQGYRMSDTVEAAIDAVVGPAPEPEPAAAPSSAKPKRGAKAAAS